MFLEFGLRAKLKEFHMKASFAMSGAKNDFTAVSSSHKSIAFCFGKFMLGPAFVTLRILTMELS